MTAGGPIDAHLHVIDAASAGRDRTGHPDGAWWQNIDASAEAVVGRAGAAGVGGGVLVQAVGAHGFDNRFVLETAARLGPQWAAVAAVGSEGPEPEPVVDAAADAGAAGVRLFSIPTPDVAWLDRDRGRRVVARCAARGLTPVLCCLPPELDAAARLVAAHPDVEFALDHAGFVPIGGEEAGLGPLLGLDNVVVKLTTGVFDHAALDPAATVRRLLELVGADRLAWGSDHPQVRDRDYAELVALVDDALDGLPDDGRTAVTERTARRLWFRRPAPGRADPARPTFPATPGGGSG